MVPEPSRPPSAVPEAPVVVPRAVSVGVDRSIQVTVAVASGTGCVVSVTCTV